ncbi:MAG: acyl-CoA synthetase [Pseudomonadota bacterium]
MSAPERTAAPEADWSRAPERSNRHALRAMCWGAVTFGRRFARCILHPISAYFVLAAPGPRRHARAYLGRVLGRPAGWRDLYRLFHAFAATILDRVYFLRGAAGLLDVRVQGAESLTQALESGQGAFLVGAHMGSFEAIGFAGRQRGGIRVAMVMYPDNARQVNAALDAIAPGADRCAIIALGRSSAMLALRDWLDEGGVAGLLADRTLAEAARRDDMVMLPFLGQPAPFGDGPFRLAALLRRPVFFMAGLYRGDNRYDVVFEPLADFSTPSADGAERERRIRAALCDYVARLEALCRAHPYNWFNFHDFWHEDGP